MPKKKNLDIVRLNLRVKSALISRFSEEALTNKEICEDARARDYVIQQSALSRYLTNNGIVVGSLTQEQILWLCCRYCISLKIDVTKENLTKARSEELLSKFFG